MRGFKMLSTERSQRSEIEHGGNIYGLAEGLNIQESKIIDFSASINPLGVSKRVIAEIKNNIKYLCNYPDPEARKLREDIGKHHDIDPESIICGNGSTELIHLIPRALKPEIVMIPAPTFSEYERACRMASYKLKVKSFELKRENNFKINPDEFISSLRGYGNSNPPLSKGRHGGIDMVFLCNPNNPTGSLLKRAEVLKIANAAKRLKCYLVVDEAFIDFCPRETIITEVQNNPYLIVLRSMTKFYALAGLRIGYGVFPSSLIERLKEFKEPWTVNTLAQKAAIAGLEDDEYADETFRLIKKEKEFLEDNFREIGIKFYPSDANFYLLKIDRNNLIDLKLRKKGILVRNCSNFKGLDSSFIRVAVKSRKDNSRLLNEIFLCQKA